MGAEAARVLEFPDDYIHGSAAPAGVKHAIPEAEQVSIPMEEEQLRPRERTRPTAGVKATQAVSLFAVIGTLFAGALMVFVVLAQVTYNEIANETVRLNAQYEELTEQQRRLEITFESVIDMKEVERYARDVLGMSRPEADVVAIVYSAPNDKVEILGGAPEEDALSGFGSFISSLLEHFKK